MRSSDKKPRLTSYDDIFSTEESQQQERIQRISLQELHPFKNHPFRVLDDDRMMETVESVKAYPTIEVQTLYGDRTYRIFAVVNMTVSDWDASAAQFSSTKEFQQYVAHLRSKALYDTVVPVAADDHILTLITCDRSYGGVSGRLLVVAVQE